MKKILLSILAIIMSISFTGCGKDTTLNLDKIKIDLADLQTGKFNFEGIMDSVEDEKHMYDDDIYDTESEIGMNYDYFESIIARKDSQTGHKYFVILPKKDKKSEIVSKMDEYLKKQTDLKTAKDEHEGYLIYVVDSEPKEIVDRIKKARGKIFSSLMEINKSDLESTMNIKESWITESLVMTPMFIVNSNLYIIVKPKRDNYDDVKKAIDDYMAKTENEWKTYLPDQYKIIKNRKFEKYGDYLIYIASTNNNLVLDTIKKDTK